MSHQKKARLISQVAADVAAGRVKPGFLDALLQALVPPKKTPKPARPRGTTR